jgi:hypothetical protein
MLQNIVTIRFDDVCPEDFVGLHMHGFRRTLRNAVLTQKQDSLHIISIQPVAGTNQRDMLFAVEMHSSEFYKPAYLIRNCPVAGGTWRTSCASQLSWRRTARVWTVRSSVVNRACHWIPTCS